MTAHFGVTLKCRASLVMSASVNRRLLEIRCCGSGSCPLSINERFDVACGSRALRLRQVKSAFPYSLLAIYALHLRFASEIYSDDNTIYNMCELQDDVGRLIVVESGDSEPPDSKV